MDCPHAGHALLEAVGPHLTLVPINECRIDCHKAESTAHAERCKNIRLAQSDDGNVDRAADFQEPRLLEIADDEGVISCAFRLQSVADRLRGAAEFRQRMK